MSHLSPLRVTPAVRAVMQVILAAPGCEAKDKDIDAATNLAWFRFFWTLMQLERNGWVAGTAKGGSRVFRALYSPEWYEARMRSEEQR